MVRLPGVKSCAKEAKAIIQCWNLFVSEDILNIIVENTNKYIAKVESKYSRERAARPTDVIEIRALLGLLYLAGCLKSNRLSTKDMWARNGTGIEIFWLTMSEQRFLFLLRCIRFDDLDTRDARKATDKLAPIRDVFTIFVNNCKRAYTMGKYGTIDEKLEAFRGRCAFKQYMPKKPNKYGLKIFALVDAKTRYTLNLEPYVGKQPEGPFRVENDASSIVLRLIEPISGTSRNITCDNWFTSFPLLNKLLQDHRTTCVGTVKKNKTALPLEFKNTKDRPEYSSVFGYQKNTTIVSYVPKKRKNVILASTMHHDDTINLSTGDKKKPEIITFYNSTKGGVDTVDELCATYNVARNTRRWPMVIFYALLNIAGINSQIVYLSNNSNKEVIRRVYLKKLSAELAEDHQKRRSMQLNIAPSIRQRRQEVAGTSVEHPRGDPVLPTIRKRCYFCTKDTKTRYFCKLCKRFLCLSHAEFLCPTCVPLPETEL